MTDTEIFTQMNELVPGLEGGMLMTRALELILLELLRLREQVAALTSGAAS
jgi:hypothetical protein